MKTFDNQSIIPPIPDQATVPEGGLLSQFGELVEGRSLHLDAFRLCTRLHDLQNSTFKISKIHCLLYKHVSRLDNFFVAREVSPHSVSVCTGV